MEMSCSFFKLVCEFSYCQSYFIPSNFCFKGAIFQRYPNADPGELNKKLSRFFAMSSDRENGREIRRNQTETENNRRDLIKQNVPDNSKDYGFSSSDEDEEGDGQLNHHGNSSASIASADDERSIVDSDADLSSEID